MDQLGPLLQPFFAYASTADPPLSPEQAALIQRVVPSVSWSTEKKLRAAGEWSTWHDTCLELHAVQDADRLDAVGAVGVMRCAAYSAAKNRILIDSNDPDGQQEGETAEAHFHDKLLMIKDRMKVGLGWYC